MIHSYGNQKENIASYDNEAMHSKTNNKKHCLKTQQLRKNGKICYLALMTKDR